MSLPATLVTIALDGSLRTSMLPMLFDPDAGAHGILHGHVARPNNQWRDLRPGSDTIAIFNGPDAYVSPAWYEEKPRTGRVVPTWNYTTVVAHGKLIAHDDPSGCWPMCEDSSTGTSWNVPIRGRSTMRRMATSVARRKASSVSS